MSYNTETTVMMREADRFGNELKDLISHGKFYKLDELVEIYERVDDLVESLKYEIKKEK